MSLCALMFVDAWLLSDDFFPAMKTIKTNGESFNFPLSFKQFSHLAMDCSYTGKIEGQISRRIVYVMQLL